MANDGLCRAKNAKNDEFYTQLPDIEKEMKHYKIHFKDKIVFCNCDDPTWSAFWKYFHLNFAELGLKKLVSTHYDREESTYKMEYTGGNDNDIEVGVKTPLERNGDFRNKECLDLLDECDIVVTNPPFSLFREYVAVLMEHQKKFLILGNMNALTYKEIFPLIRDNLLWYGASIHSGDRKFYVPDNYPLKASGCGVDENGRKFIRVKGVRWYTNLDYKAKMLFNVCKGITDVQDWGLLYNKYHNKQYNSNTLEADVQKLIMDDDVTKNSGIVPYVLSDRTKHDEKNLSIRAFTDAQKRRAYERQKHKCAICEKNGIDTEYAYNEMQGDHIIPWSQGGRTIDSNLQMLCQKCNNDKSNQ